MNRRAFIAVITGWLTLLKNRALGYGYVDVRRHVALRQQGIYLRVLLDGRDVTAHCYAADDRQGYVCLYKTNAAGSYDVERGALASEVRRARRAVRFVAVSRTEWERRRKLQSWGGYEKK
jgi:hypothetical protein